MKMLLEFVSVASPLSTYLFPKKIDENNNYLLRRPNYTTLLKIAKSIIVYFKPLFVLQPVVSQQKIKSPKLRSKIFSRIRS